jgi:parallel beta-helix repeat protein
LTAAAKVTSLTRCEVIGSPGKYRLDADVSATPGFACFEISAGNVTLILNGHTISTSSAGDDFGVEAEAFGINVVGPGTITGASTAAIFLAGGSGRVRGVTATGNDVGILMVLSAGNSVRGNVVTGNGSGIVAGTGATGNSIIGNFVHFNATIDLLDGNINCDSNVWRGNSFGSASPSSCIH